MVSVQNLSLKMKNYLNNHINSLGESNPIIKLSKPIITRIIDNKFNKVESALSLIADKDNNIDVEGILSEFIEQISSVTPFTTEIPIIGNIELGGGFIKVNLPMTSKKLVFNTTDLENFKQSLISN